MKSQSNINPDALKVNALGNNKYEIIKCDNVEQITVEGDTLYAYDQVLHTEIITTRTQAIIAFIRLRYSQDDEFALTNKGVVDNQDAEYIAYREYVDWCKEQVDVYFKDIEVSL
jgi:hypothetical protein